MGRDAHKPAASSPEKEAVPAWEPINLTDAEKRDMIRRIQRFAPGTDVQGDCIMVTRPNGSVVRVTMDRVIAIRWDEMR